MRPHSISRVVALSSALMQFACKDTTASGPPSVDSQSDAVPSSPVFAKLKPGCRSVKGNVVLTEAESPNEPRARIVGPSQGGLKGVVTTRFTSIVPAPGGGYHFDTADFWILGPTDTFSAIGVGRDAFLSGSDYDVDITTNIRGGTGQFAGATGSIHLLGVVHNLIGAGSGSGKTYFDLHYTGSVCT